ncbi:MAG: hypothetical protein ACPK85_01410 [Methanosarcina sp.]
MKKIDNSKRKISNKILNKISDKSSLKISKKIWNKEAREGKINYEYMAVMNIQQKRKSEKFECAR